MSYSKYTSTDYTKLVALLGEFQAGGAKHSPPKTHDTRLMFIFPMLSYPVPSYPIPFFNLSHLVLSHRILSYLVLPYFISSYLIRKTGCPKTPNPQHFK